MENYEDNNNSSSGNKGKFSERLKKIRLERLGLRKYRSVNNMDEEYKIVTVGRNILKVVLAIPSVIYYHIVDGKDKSKTVSVLDVSMDDNIFFDKERDLDNVSDENIILYDDIRKLKVNKIKDIDIRLLKKKYESFVSINNEFISKNNSFDEAIRIEKRKKIIQKEIVDLIKKKLVKNINEFEILQSELYVLKELGIEDVYLIDCQQNIKEIKKLLSKVNTLKEKYDYLKDNVDFQYMLEYDDNFLIDKILEFKDICSRDDIKKTIDDYKILDEYKYLYLKIDKIQEDIIKLEEEKNKKAIELRERDINFDRLKEDIYDVDRENERYDIFVKEQEQLLKELDDKISKIDSYEKVTYRLKGFNKLLGNSFKYLGLLLVNPLKGLIPGIATQTLITKNIVHNLYNNLCWEEDRKTVYDAIDYSLSISNYINNLNETSSLVDSTLEEIILLKNKYKKEFSKYSDSFSSYEDAIKKINKIENAVLGSKIKIDSMKIKMKDKERENNSKLKMVKKLNSSNN